MLFILQKGFINNGVKIKYSFNFAFELVECRSIKNLNMCAQPQWEKVKDEIISWTYPFTRSYLFVHSLDTFSAYRNKLTKYCTNKVLRQRSMDKRRQHVLTFDTKTTRVYRSSLITKVYFEKIWTSTRFQFILSKRLNSMVQIRQGEYHAANNSR